MRIVTLPASLRLVTSFGSCPKTLAKSWRRSSVARWMGPGSCVLSTMVTEELMLMGAVCANADVAAAERPSTTMKGREEAQDGTRREKGIRVTSRGFGGN